MNEPSIRPPATNPNEQRFPIAPSSPPRPATPAPNHGYPAYVPPYKPPTRGR